jgi:hypothetical protein
LKHHQIGMLVALVLDQITDRVGIIEVTRVLSQSAICTVVEGEAGEGDTLQAVQ